MTEDGLYQVLVIAQLSTRTNVWRKIFPSYGMQIEDVMLPKNENPDFFRSDDVDVVIAEAQRGVFDYGRGEILQKLSARCPDAIIIALLDEDVGSDYRKVLRNLGAAGLIHRKMSNQEIAETIKGIIQGTMTLY